MNLFDFVTQDEMDDLPEDPRLAFSNFVQIAQQRLSEHTRPLFESQDEIDWQEAWDARYNFVNIVSAAAHRLGIEMFSLMEVPEVGDLTSGRYRQFVADIDHYMTQLALDSSLRSKSDSTPVPDSSKERIRTHLYHLREAIDSSNLTDAKKAQLKKKVDEFEEALGKSRLHLMAVARLTVEILAVPGAVWASYDITAKLITNINQAVAEAKAVDDEQRKLSPHPEPFAIASPRAAEPKRKKAEEEPNRGFTQKLDDEIPF